MFPRRLLLCPNIRNDVAQPLAPFHRNVIDKHLTRRWLGSCHVLGDQAPGRFDGASLRPIRIDAAVWVNIDETLPTFVGDAKSMVLRSPILVIDAQAVLTNQISDEPCPALVTELASSGRAKNSCSDLISMPNVKQLQGHL
jgi:hypothetical protein